MNQQKQGPQTNGPGYPSASPLAPLPSASGGGRSLASLGPSRLGPPCLRRVRLGTSVSRPGPLAVCVAVLAGHSGDPVRPARQPRGPSPGRTWPVRRGSGGGVRAVSSEPSWRPLRCLRRAGSRPACGIQGPLFTLGSCPLSVWLPRPRPSAPSRRWRGREQRHTLAHHVAAQSRRDQGWAARQTGPPQDSDPGGGGRPPPIHDPIVVPSFRSPTPSAGSAGHPSCLIQSRSLRLQIQPMPLLPKPGIIGGFGGAPRVPAPVAVPSSQRPGTIDSSGRPPSNPCPAAAASFRSPSASAASAGHLRILA